MIYNFFSEYMQYTFLMALPPCALCEREIRLNPIASGSGFNDLCVFSDHHHCHVMCRFHDLTWTLLMTHSVTQVFHMLKTLPSSHSSATWCIMVNVSMWCLPTTVHKEWCARYYYRTGMIKKVIHFNRKTPSFCNMMYTHIFYEHISIKFFNKSTISFVV